MRLLGTVRHTLGNFNVRKIMMSSKPLIPEVPDIATLTAHVEVIAVYSFKLKCQMLF
jgi:hypothetical protein